MTTETPDTLAALVRHEVHAALDAGTTRERALEDHVVDRLTTAIAAREAERERALRDECQQAIRIVCKDRNAAYNEKDTALAEAERLRKNEYRHEVAMGIADTTINNLGAQLAAAKEEMRRLDQLCGDLGSGAFDHPDTPARTVAAQCASRIVATVLASARVVDTEDMYDWWFEHIVQSLQPVAAPAPETGCVCVDAAENPDCKQFNDKYSCTRPKGHAGEHVACSVYTHRLATWPAQQEKRLINTADALWGNDHE